MFYDTKGNIRSLTQNFCVDWVFEFEAKSEIYKTTMVVKCILGHFDIEMARLKGHDLCGQQKTWMVYSDYF